jgi:hypothetical protein
MDLFDTVVLEVNQKVDQLKNALATGRSASYEEYKFLCGEIKGLLYIKDYVLDLKRQLENSDDE